MHRICKLLRPRLVRVASGVNPMCNERRIGYAVLLAVTMTVGLCASAQQSAPAPPAKETQTLPPGFAQVEGDSIPLADAVWALFVHTTALDEQGIADGRSILKDMGLDAVSAEVVFRHMRASIDDKKQSDVSRKANFCSKRAQIVSREDIVKEMDDMTRAAKQERDRSLDELPKLVDPPAYASLLAEAGKLRSSMSKVEIDPAVYFAAAPAAAVSDALRHGCDPPPPSSPRSPARQR